MEPDLPIELIIQGYPVSHQAKKSGAREEWKEEVSRQAWAQLEELQEGHFLLQQLLVVTVYYFPQAPLAPDLDNATKPVLDSLSKCAFADDRLIERLVIQRFEPERAVPILDDSPKLEEAIASTEATIYIRLEAFGEEE